MLRSQINSASLTRILGLAVSFSSALSLVACGEESKPGPPVDNGGTGGVAAGAGGSGGTSGSSTGGSSMGGSAGSSTGGSAAAGSGGSASGGMAGSSAAGGTAGSAGSASGGTGGGSAAGGTGGTGGSSTGGSASGGSASGGSSAGGTGGSSSGGGSGGSTGGTGGSSSGGSSSGGSGGIPDGGSGGGGGSAGNPNPFGMVFPVAPCKTDRAWAEKTADFVDPTPLGLVAPLNTMAGAGKVLTLAHQDTHPAGPYFSVSGSELTSEGEAWPLAFIPNEVASSFGTDYFEFESVVQGIGYLKLTDDSTTQFVPMVNVSIKGWALDVGCTDVGITVVGSILESDGDTYSFTVGGTTKTLRQWAGPPLTDRWTIVVNVRADQTPFDFDPFTP